MCSKHQHYLVCTPELDLLQQECFLPLNVACMCNETLASINGTNAILISLMQ
jgi:hypothetical protein